MPVTYISDFIHLPYTHDLTEGGIAYALRSLPYTYNRMGGSSYDRLRRIVAGVAVELAGGRVVQPEEIVGSMRKGRKIAYSGDTRPFEAFVGFAADADLMVHESTFDDALAEKAEADGHSTPSQAALQAKRAGAKKLALTHISARYPNAELLLEQAKKVFEDTVVAEDFLVLELPLPKG